MDPSRIGLLTYPCEGYGIPFTYGPCPSEAPQGGTKGGCALSARRLEAVGAKHRSVTFRLERNLGGFTALAASDVVHLPGSVIVATASIELRLFSSAASRTTNRSVLETLFGVELLFVGRPDEGVATIAAG